MTAFKNVRQTWATATDVVSLTTAKAHLKVEHSAEDTLITSLIGAAYDAVERYTNSFLQRETVRCYVDDPVCVIQVKLAELPQVKTTDGGVGVQYLDTDGSTQTMDSADYNLDPYEYPARLVLEEVPSVDDVPNAFWADFTCGYTDDGSGGPKRPDALVQAMLLIIGDMYANRQDVSDRRTYAVPTGSARLMEPHRKFVY